MARLFHLKQPDYENQTIDLNQEQRKLNIFNRMTSNFGQPDNRISYNKESSKDTSRGRDVTIIQSPEKVSLNQIQEEVLDTEVLDTDVLGTKVLNNEVLNNEVLGTEVLDTE